MYKVEVICTRTKLVMVDTYTHTFMLIYLSIDVHCVSLLSLAYVYTLVSVTKIFFKPDLILTNPSPEKHNSYLQPFQLRKII